MWRLSSPLLMEVSLQLCKNIGKVRLADEGGSSLGARTCMQEKVRQLRGKEYQSIP